MPACSVAHAVSERRPSKGGAVDGRTLIARRRRNLIATYTAALGGQSLSESQLIAVRRAAELTALAEQARAKMMRDGVGDAAELSVMVRLESTAARAVRALGLKPGTADATLPWRPSRGRLAAQLAAGADGATSG